MWRSSPLFFLLLLCHILDVSFGQNKKKQGQQSSSLLLKDEGKDLECDFDIAYILDSSESSKYGLFQKQKDFVANFSLKLMDITLNNWKLNIRLALLQFSSHVKKEFHFQDWENVEKFNSKVYAMNYIGHGTYSFYAITNATQLFHEEAKPHAVKVALLMTDGVDHPKSPDALNAAAEAKNNNIKLFTIGLSDIARRTPINAKLRSLASSPAQQYVYSLTDQDLQDTLFLQLVSVYGIPLIFGQW
ncbi:COSA1 protein, partial [Polypterus senegalus]